MNSIHIISSLERGGAQRCLIDQNPQTVIYFHDGPMRQELEKLGARCIRIQAPGGYVNPLFLWRLWRTIKRFQPETLRTDLWAANLYGRIIAKLVRIPCTNVMHNEPTLNGTVRNLIDRLVPFTATKIIAVSKSIQKKIPGSVYVPNSINAERLYQEAAAQKILPLPEGFIIGTVGRLVPVKNYDILLRSCAELVNRFPQLRLVIIGSGPQEQALRALATQLKLNQYASFLGDQPAAGYYQHFDCFVQPSQSEGLSIALLEALAFKVPVIVTSPDGVHEVVQDGVQGRLIKPGDAQALTQALVHLMHTY